MRVLFMSALFSLCVGGISACAKEGGGRSACASGRCIVSLLQILGDPARYDKKRILVVGYLAIDNHVLSLYPTEEHYKIGDPASSIGFHIPASHQTKISSSDLYKYVRVDGILSAQSHGFDNMRVADFVEIFSINSVRIKTKEEREVEPAVSVDLLNK